MAGNNEVVVDGDANLSIIRSTSETESPDDIIDMEERYSTHSRRRRSFSSKGRNKFVEDPHDSGAEIDELSFSSDVFGSIDELDSFSETADSIHNERESYISRIMEKLQIKDVLEGFHGSRSKHHSITSRHRVASEDEDSVASDTKELETKLKREKQKSKDLEVKLVAMQRIHETECNEYQHRILALESKLAMQEQIFVSQLEKQRGLRLEAFDTAVDGVNHDSQIQKDTERALRRDISKLQATCTTLGTSMDEREAHCDRYMEEANTKIRDLEHQLHERTQQLEAQNARNKMIELELEKKRSELDSKRGQPLEASESQSQTLLAVERKRVETLTGMNARMKTAMKRLSKKTICHGETNEEVEELRRQLEKRDTQLALIKEILKGKNSGIDSDLSS